MKTAYHTAIRLLIFAACLAVPAAGMADVLYVSDWGNGTPGSGSIKKIFPDGTVTTFVSGLTGGPEGIAFDSHGNLFIALQRPAVIDKVTPDGTLTTFASYNTSASGVAVDLLSGLAIDSSDNLYVSQAFPSEIDKITPSGIRSVFFTPGSPNADPFGLVFGANGDLYSSFMNGSAVVQITPAGEGSPVMFISNPTGLAFDSHGNLFITRLTGGIWKVDSENNMHYFTDSMGEEGLATDRSGNLYAADYQQTTITKITADGTHSQFASGFTTPSFIASINPLGDFNRDGQFNAKDIGAMIAALANQNDYLTAHNLTNEDLLSIGDINGDGKFNNADLQALINLLQSGGGSTNSVPEPSTLVLAVLAALMVGLFRRVS